MWNTEEWLREKHREIECQKPKKLLRERGREGERESKRERWGKKKGSKKEREWKSYKKHCFFWAVLRFHFFFLPFSPLTHVYVLRDLSYFLCQAIWWNERLAERERVPVVGPLAQPLKSLFFCEYHSIIIRSSTEKDIQIGLKEKLKSVVEEGRRYSLLLCEYYLVIFRSSTEKDIQIGLKRKIEK